MAGLESNDLIGDLIDPGYRVIHLNCTSIVLPGPRGSFLSTKERLKPLKGKLRYSPCASLSINNYFIAFKALSIVWFPFPFRAFGKLYMNCLQSLGSSSFKTKPFLSVLSYIGDVLFELQNYVGFSQYVNIIS